MNEVPHSAGRDAPARDFDLLVIGGGINGAGIARDAAGRGLRVALCEQADLAQGTSSRSSGLIHGGLRYLEYGELRLVRESLREREVLLAMAPHLVRPITFVLPYVAQLRPAWMLRLGLFLYDHLAPRKRLPACRSVHLAQVPEGAAVRSQLQRAFLYADCRTDDARLVVHNALDAARRGAQVWTRTRFLGASPQAGRWQARVQDLRSGQIHTLGARALVNAAGPWVHTAGCGIEGAAPARRVRLVRGSHLVVPKFWQGEHGYLLQNRDRRVIFVTPYEGAFALIGTTDIAHDQGPEDALATAEELQYLCAAVNGQLRCTLDASQAVWTFSGVRCLVDDASENPSALTRDYVLELARPGLHPPLLTVLGGKITTFRRLAQNALALLQPVFPHMGPAWTEGSTLAGGEMSAGDRGASAQSFVQQNSFLPHDHAASLFARHGSLAAEVLDGRSCLAALGRHFGAGLYECEADYLIRKEWARTTEDLLWRRSKFGLHLNAVERSQFGAWLARAPIPIERYAVS